MTGHRVDGVKVEAVVTLEAVVATAVRPKSPCVSEVDATAPRLVLGRGARVIDGTCVVDVSFEALHEPIELEMHGAS